MCSSDLIKFSINGHRREISFDEFCNIFGFPAGRLIDKTISEEIRHQSASIWLLISVNGNTDFLRAKIATIQNPTIRYFAYFLSNSLFARGEMSSMTTPDICVLYQSLQGGANTPRCNLGSLLVAHFHRQRSAGAEIGRASCRERV